MMVQLQIQEITLYIACYKNTHYSTMKAACDKDAFKKIINKTSKIRKIKEKFDYFLNKS